MNRVVFKSQSVEWPTPKALYEKLNAEFAFDFDPCPSMPENIEGDGLSRLFVPWAGKRVFCNPPYGNEIKKWLERAREAELAVYLLPARTDTRWFHELCLPFALEIRFIKGRLKFGGAKHAAPFPSMLVIFKSQRPIISGKCACGCGGDLEPAKKTRTARGIRKGEYAAFIKGHNARAERKR